MRKISANEIAKDSTAFLFPHSFEEKNVMWEANLIFKVKRLGEDMKDKQNTYMHTKIVLNFFIALIWHVYEL